MKPEAANRVRTFKKYQAESKGFTVLIVGNSRVEMGIDPNSPLFNSRKVYNIGVPGISLQAQIAYADNLLASNPIKEIIIGVDFVDFLTRQNTTLKEFQFQQDYLKDYLSASLSLDALKSSAFTLFGQSKYASTRTEQGFNPAFDYIPILNSEGQDVLTSQKLASLRAQINNKQFDVNLMIVDKNSPLNVLASSVERWEQSGIKTRVFINPYQDLYYEALKEARLSESFESWRELVKSNITLMDSDATFIDFTELGIESSNIRNTNGNLKFFWEPAHYKKELGNEMLERLLIENVE